MTEKLDVLKNIAAQLINEPPLFIATAIQNIIDLFLFALLVFLCILLLQISNNLVFHKGKHLPKQGLCCIVLSIAFITIFAPDTFSAPPLKELESVKLITYENGQEIAKKSLQYYDKLSVFEALSSISYTRDLFELPPIEKENGRCYKIIIALQNRKESQFTITEDGIYYSNLPDNGEVSHITAGSEGIYALLNNDNI